MTERLKILEPLGLVIQHVLQRLGNMAMEGGTTTQEHAAIGNLLHECMGEAVAGLRATGRAGGYRQALHQLSFVQIIEVNLQGLRLAAYGSQQRLTKYGSDHCRLLDEAQGIGWEAIETRQEQGLNVRGDIDCRDVGGAGPAVIIS